MQVVKLLKNESCYSSRFMPSSLPLALCPLSTAELLEDRMLVLSRRRQGAGGVPLTSTYSPSALGEVGHL